MNLPKHSTEALAEATGKAIVDLGTQLVASLNSHRGALAFQARILMIIISAGKADKRLISVLKRTGPPKNWPSDDPRRSGWLAAKKDLIDDLKAHWKI